MDSLIRKMVGNTTDLLTLGTFIMFLSNMDLLMRTGMWALSEAVPTFVTCVWVFPGTYPLVFNQASTRLSSSRILGNHRVSPQCGFCGASGQNAICYHIYKIFLHGAAPGLKKV